MAALGAARRIVVKIGSALLVDRNTGGLKTDWLSRNTRCGDQGNPITRPRQQSRLCHNRRVGIDRRGGDQDCRAQSGHPHAAALH